MKQHQKVVLALGTAGLIPFLSAPLLLLMGYIAIANEIARLYGLAIVCFLAGSWWGIALVAGKLTSYERMTVLIISNLVVIGAVLALLLLSPGSSQMALAGVLVLQLLIERTLRGLTRQPSYYLLMRLALSTVAASCLLVVAWLS